MAGEKGLMRRFALSASGKRSDMIEGIAQWDGKFPARHYGKISGVLGRSEFGLAMVVTVA